MVSWVLAAWHLARCATRSSHPVLIVASGGTYERGDVLWLWNATQELQVGEVVAYRPGENRDLLSTHRLVEIRRNTGTGQDLLLTKGDDNRVNDRGSYAPGRLWLLRRDVAGKVVGVIPHNIGTIALALRDYPVLWYFAIARGLMKGKLRAFWFVAMLSSLCYS